MEIENRCAGHLKYEQQKHYGKPVELMQYYYVT